MPASEFEWSTIPTGPIFQVYGTKRKAVEEQVKHVCDRQNDQNPKRRCEWPQPGSREDLHQQAAFPQDPLFNNNNNNNIVDQCNTMDSMEVNHNTPTMQDHHEIFQAQQHQQIMNPALSLVMSQHPPRVPSPWPSHQHIHQNNHIMDLNDETFNPMATAAAAEAEAASVGMDSDCVPNPQQYQNSKTHHGDSEFCKNYCGVGEASPTSGRVRCFCKPSWEGMMDMRPYVSDVY